MVNTPFSDLQSHLKDISVFTGEYGYLTTLLNIHAW